MYFFLQTPQTLSVYFFTHTHTHTNLKKKLPSITAFKNDVKFEKKKKIIKIFYYKFALISPS